MIQKRLNLHKLKYVNTYKIRRDDENQQLDSSAQNSEAETTNFSLEAEHCCLV